MSGRANIPDQSVLETPGHPSKHTTMNDPLALSRELFFKGIEHFESGRYTEACTSFQAALSLAPGRPSILANLGLSLCRLQRFDEAIAILKQADAAQPGQPDILLNLGQSLARVGDLRAALQSFEQAVKVAPDFAPAWSERGSLLRELHQLDEAAHCFERALELGADPELHRFYLAAVKQETTAEPPRRYVESLFDDYATDFEEHLVGSLKYCGYERLVRPLLDAGKRFATVIDLGCGTGLCGKLIAPIAVQVDGVDLSRGMLERARQTGHYRELIHADIGAFLQDTVRQADLVLAADVFGYIKDLQPIFHGVRRILTPGGCFAFTVERAESGQDVELRPSLRHAHSADYVRRLATACGLSLRDMQVATLREDQTDPVKALYIYLE